MSTTGIRYGGDYNPEQWPREVWEEDYAAFDQARINTLSLGVFGWAHLQPAEDRYDFSRLDAIVERAIDRERIEPPARHRPGRRELLVTAEQLVRELGGQRQLHVHAALPRRHAQITL